MELLVMALLALLAVQAEEVSIRLMFCLVVTKLFTTIAEQIFKCHQHLSLLLFKEVYLYLCMYLCICICVFLFVYLCIMYCAISTLTLCFSRRLLCKR